MKTIQLDTFYQYQYLGNVAYSPNKQKCVFQVAKANLDHNCYDHYLYLYANGHYQQLTYTGKEQGFIWDDNQTLLFQALRDEKDQKKAKELPYTVYYRLSLNGGEAYRAFALPLEVTRIEKVKEHLYLISATYHKDFKTFGKSEQDAKDIINLQNQDADFEVLEELPFYFNGAGFVDGKRCGLFLYDETKNECVPVIYQQDIQVNSFVLNEDHTKVAIITSHQDGCRSDFNEIVLYDIASKQLSTILKDGMYVIYDVQFFHDAILFAGTDMQDYGLNQNPDFYKINLQTKECELFVKYGESLSNTVGSDCRLIAGKSSLVKDGIYYFITTRMHSSVVYGLNASGDIFPFLIAQGSCDCFDIGNDGVICVGMYQMKLQELYCYHDNQLTQLTHFNDWIEEYYVAKPYTQSISNEGCVIHGWVLLPKDFDKNKTYPAILDIHGGPKTVYGEVFYHEMQAWVNAGYIVFFLNPHGGDGRGNDFMDIRGKYGTIDFDDIMLFCDYVIKEYPQIDQNNIAVTGGSYGGFMTNWIIGHTNRFRVAVSQRSIANWISFENTSDIGVSFVKDQQQATSWTNMEKLWFHSPLAYADKVNTPTLFIHSDCDYRCPISEGYQMYSALKANGVDSRLCLFHGENHDLSRSGKPHHRLRRLHEITKWIVKYTN